MNNTVQKRLKQTAATLIALTLILSVFGPAGTAVGAQGEQGVSVTQSQSSVTAAPGDTVELTTTLEITNLNAHGFEATLPTGWEGTITDAAGGSPKPLDGPGNPLEIIWTNRENTREISYTVQVPEDASAGEYTVDVEGSAVVPDTGEYVTSPTQTTITVETEQPTTTTTETPTTTTTTQTPTTTEKPTTTTTEKPTTTTTTTTTTTAENQQPNANAGDDQEVVEGESVMLDGSGSSDDDGSVESYAWSQTGDPTVSLSDADTANPSFVAPQVSEKTTLAFELEVTDDDGTTATDTVAVTVQPEADAPGDTKETGLSLSPASQTVNTGDTATYDLVVESAEGGVGAFEAGIELADPSVATITDVTVQSDPGLPYVDVQYTDSGAEIDAATMDTANTGAVTIATITVEGDAAGTSDLSIVSTGQNDGILLFDEAGTGGGYAVTDTTGASFTVETPSPASFAVSGLNAPETVVQGDSVSVSATIDNVGDDDGSEDVTVTLDGQSVGSQSVTLAGGENTLAEFQVATDGFDPGTYTLEVSTEDDSQTSDLTVTPPAVIPSFDPSNDLDGDGVYEDVNGDGSFDVGDVQAFFAQRDSAVIQNNAALFDLNGDGSFDVGDVQRAWFLVTQ